MLHLTCSSIRGRQRLWLELFLIHFVHSNLCTSKWMNVRFYRRCSSQNFFFFVTRAASVLLGCWSCKSLDSTGAMEKIAPEDVPSFDDLMTAVVESSVWLIISPVSPTDAQLGWDLMMVKVISFRERSEIIPSLQMTAFAPLTSLLCVHHFS